MSDFPFLSSEWLKSLGQELRRTRAMRESELRAVFDTFGESELLAQYCSEPKWQQHNPVDYNEDEPGSFHPQFSVWDGKLQKRLRFAVMTQLNIRHPSPCLFLVVLALGTAITTLAASYGKESRTPGEEIFDNKTVLSFRIEISSNELETLRRDDLKRVRATVREGSNVWDNVGLHIKGGSGSRRSIDDRPSLTLRFNEFIPSQRFHDLRKIHLNNSVQDRSYMCENICSELFRKAGVPTPRVSYATVSINGLDKGLYVLKEGFTKDMLGIYFKNTGGNLYDGGFLREITDQLENDGGSGDNVTDWSDLKALAKAAQEPDAEKRWEKLNRVLGVDRFISYAALEVMTWDWDGYLKNRNNYRVYHDLDTGKLIFFPHGMDQMFWEPQGQIMPDDWFGSVVALGLIKNTSQGRELYLKRFGEIYTNVLQIQVITNRVNELATLLRPYAAPDYDGQVKRIRDLIVARHTYLGRVLRDDPPIRQSLR